MRARTLSYGVLACGLLTLVSCAKPDEDLGLGLLPGDPLGVVAETTPCRAYTLRDTVVRTSGLTRNLVGSYLDPEFGTIRTGLVTQLRLTTNNVGAGQDITGLQPDSIVLALAFELPNYGTSTLNAQQFRVFELSESLSVDSLYYTDDVPSVLAEDLVYPHAGLIVPAPFVGPTISGATLLPQLRIRLRTALAQRFLAAFGTDSMVDNPSFLAFFKGLYVTVDNGEQPPLQGGVLHINSISSASKLTVYYKDINSTDPGLTRTFDLDINSNGVRYTVVEHDHSRAMEPGLAQALVDTAAPSPITHLQTLGGFRTALRFPDLLSFASGERALAKAELVVPVVGATYPYHTPPTQVFIFRQDENGKDLFLPDQLQGIGSIGGQYNSTTREYRFNITRYVQGVLIGAYPNNGLELVAGSSGISAGRVVLGGPANSDRPTRMELTFTTY